MIGCQKHGRERQEVKRLYNIYGIHTHCWCGYDLKRSWQKNASGDPWVYEVFEKTICSPERHFTEYAKCPSTRGYSYSAVRPGASDGWKVNMGPIAQCGMHGLSYEHCRLCTEALPGMVEGMINGEWQYSPWTIAKRIFSALRK